MEHSESTRWYFAKLVKEGEELIEQKDFYGAAAAVSSRYNFMRLGWINEVQDFYYNPETEEDRSWVTRMQQVLQGSTGGLLENAQPTRIISEYMHVEKAAKQLYILGVNAPREMINRTRELAVASRNVGLDYKLAENTLKRLGQLEQLLEDNHLESK